MRISPETVDELHDFFEENQESVTALINDARGRLGETFGEDVDKVTQKQVRDGFEEAVQDEDTALNLAALYRVGVELEVKNDYAGFVVDEMIGRKIAATVAGNDPERSLAEATFHYIDVHTEEVLEEDGRKAGEDDVLAGIAAGIQTRLPGWEWQESEGI